MAEEENVQAPEEGEVERQARSMGWQPREDWKGKPESWVEADEFVKRGETFIPFLQHDRRKLKAELEQEKQGRLALQQELSQMKESVEALKTFNEGMAAERRERRKGEIAQELKSAREEGNDLRVAELQNELGEVVKPAPRGNGAAPAPRPPEAPVIQPWVRQFLESNADFFQSGRKVALFNAVMLEKRQAGDTRVGPEEGTALLNEAREEVERALGGNPRRSAAPRTEESRPAGGGRAPAGGKSYADLPPEAREQCDKQEPRFTGERKLFKTQAEWRRHFASEYFGPSAITREG